MLSRINATNSLNFQSKQMASKMLEQSSKGFVESVKKAGSVIGAGAGAYLLAEKKEAYKEDIKAFNELPENTNYMTDAERQSAAELTGRLTAAGLVSQGRLIDGLIAD